MDSISEVVPYTYSSFQQLKKHFNKKLTQIGITVTDEEIARITFLSRRKYDRYDHFPLGEPFYVRFIRWLTNNFSKHERQDAFSIIKNIKFVDQYELKELTISTFENIKNHIVSKMKADGGNTWFSYIENRNAYLESELKYTLFIACADDIRFDFFRRYAMRTHPKPFQKDNFIEYYKLDEPSIKKLPEFKRVVLIDQLSASGTTILRKPDDEWTGKFHRFIDIWSSRIQDIPIIYCPYVLSHVSKTNLYKKIPLWKKDIGLQNEIEIISTSEISISPCLADITGKRIDENSPVAQLCKEKYSRFIEDDHIRLGGGAEFGYGQAGLTLVFQSNCPNSTLPMLWHDFNDWYPLFPRVSHHR